MELHDQCACNLARARSAARSSPEGGTRAGGKDGSWLAAQSPPARPASPLRELPPQFATPRQRSAARPAPTLAFKCQSSAISGLFQRRGRLPPVPPRAQERTTRTHRGIRSRARPASLRRVSPARDHLSYAPSLTATRPSLCGRHIPPFLFDMPQRDSSASALAPRLSPEARGL